MVGQSHCAKNRYATDDNEATCYRVAGSRTINATNLILDPEYREYEGWTRPTLEEIAQVNDAVAEAQRCCGAPKQTWPEVIDLTRVSPAEPGSVPASCFPLTLRVPRRSDAMG
jgi:hypothetical protein